MPSCIISGDNKILWVVLGLKLMAANQLPMSNLNDYHLCIIICTLKIII